MRGDPTALAHGTGPENMFDMKGADIVVGHAGGVDIMYAESFVGAPSAKGFLEVTDAETAVAGGRISLAFTRPLVGGKLQAEYGVNASVSSPMADVFWAVGAYDAAAGGAEYHQHGRGLRFVR